MYKFSSLTSYKMPKLGSSPSGICIYKNTGGLFPINPSLSSLFFPLKKLFIHFLTCFLFWNYNYIISTLPFPPSKLSHIILLALSNAWPFLSLIAVISKYISTYTFLNTACPVCIILSVLFLQVWLFNTGWPIRVLFPGKEFLYYSQHSLVVRSSLYRVKALWAFLPQPLNSINLIYLVISEILIIFDK